MNWKDLRALTDCFFRKLQGIKLKKCNDMYIGRNTKNEKFEFDNFVL